MLEWIIVFILVIVLAACSSLVTRKSEDYHINVRVESNNDECTATASASREHEDTGDQKTVEKP